MQVVLESIWRNFDITRAAFLIFLATSVVAYYLCPKRIRWGVLLLASLTFFFLAGDGFKWFPYIITGGLVSWGAGLLLQYPKTSKWVNHLILILFITLTFGAFIYYRCMDFFWSADHYFGEIFSIHLGLNKISIIAPLGISYWTLTIISYVTDVYRGIIPAENNFLKVLTFAAYFPQMTCGPITRYAEMKEELFVGHSFSYRNITFGAQRIIWGFFKKIVIADRLAVLVGTVYNTPANYPGWYVVIAIFFFGIQLFCDFSGCIDIVIGASELFGIRLPENFAAPFLSKTVQEFYQKWHITLGLWGKDYIMYPLLKCRGTQALADWLRKQFGKKIAKKFTLYVGLLACWMVIGFWHGGSLKFLLSTGLIPALYMILGDLLDPSFKWLNRALRIQTDTFGFRVLQYLRTIFLIYAGVWAIFAASSLRNAVDVLHAIWPLNNIWVLFDYKSIFQLGLDIKDINLVVFGITLVLAVEVIHHNSIRIRQFLSEQPIVFRWFIYLGSIFFVLIFGAYGPGYDAHAFIYKG